MIEKYLRVKKDISGLLLRFIPRNIKKDFLDRFLDMYIEIGKKLWNLYNMYFAMNFKDVVPWYDHRYDWVYGPENWGWVERGIVGLKMIRDGDKVLDLCCGDGIYSALFFSKRASLVHGIDISEDAVKSARRWENSKFRVFKCDVVKDPFPLRKYDVIILFTSLQYITPQDGISLIKKIYKSLGRVFVGSVPLHEQKHRTVKNFFLREEDVKNFLKPVFKRVEIERSVWRDEVYFFCYK